MKDSEMTEADYEAIWKAWSHRKIIDYMALPESKKKQWPELLYRVEVKSFLENLHRAGYEVRRNKPSRTSKTPAQSGSPSKASAAEPA